MNEQYVVGDLIYDANIYDGMNTQLDDLQFYRKWLPTHKNSRILELCCGTGRLTIPIAQSGHHITGVDHTPSMLKQAKIKASKHRLNIDFIEADIRYLNLKSQYDLIFIPFNSIHHLYLNTDLFSTLAVVKKHLNRNGRFILDCFNPDLNLIVEGTKQRQQLAQYTTEDGRDITIEQQMRYQNSSQINRIKWHYYINQKFDSTQSLDMRVYFPQELDTYLNFSGFNILHKFGSFAEDNFNDSSEKQIFICQLSN